jgi:hypothetical protein
MQQWWFIGNQLFLNVFRASLCPSSGEQTACHCLCCPVLAMVVVPESRVAKCVHCAEDGTQRILESHKVHRKIKANCKMGLMCIYQQHNILDKKCRFNPSMPETSSVQCTHLATWLSGTTTIARTGKHRQWHAVCSPDDGCKDARNMLRNNWLPINHHLLHLVGLAFISLCVLQGERVVAHTH